MEDVSKGRDRMKVITNRWVREGCICHCGVYTHGAGTWLVREGGGCFGTKGAGRDEENTSQVRGRKRHDCHPGLGILKLS